MVTKKRAVQESPPQPVAFSEWETGVLDALSLVTSIVDETTESFRPAVMTAERTPAGHLLSANASAAQSLLGHVRAACEMRVLRLLNERRANANKATP